MLDAGCGEGHCVRYFSDGGIRAAGFDGLMQNVEHSAFLHAGSLCARGSPVLAAGRVRDQVVSTQADSPH
jgi:hypothetical protein